MSDLELLSAWSGGDQRAGDRLVRRYMRAVVRFFRNKTSDDLDDLVQQTFLGCIESVARFRGEGSFRSYLFGVACHVLARYYRAKYRDDKRVSLDEVSFHDLSPGPSLAFAQRREHELLLTALRRLPVSYQVVLELHFWEEMTTREIAVATAVPHGTAQTRLRRAREQLAALLERTREAFGVAAVRPPDVDAWVGEMRAAL